MRTKQVLHNITSISISNRTEPFGEGHMIEKGVIRQHCKKWAHLCHRRSEHIALYFKGHPLQKNPTQEAGLIIKDHILHFETGQCFSQIFLIISCSNNRLLQFHRLVLTWNHLLISFMWSRNETWIKSAKYSDYCLPCKFKALSSRWGCCPGVSSAMGPLANSPFPPWEAPESFILSLFCSSFSPWFPGSVGEHPWM